MIYSITEKKARIQGSPAPIWWAKACRQIGIEPSITEIEEDNKRVMGVTLPDLPEDVFLRVQERAELLQQKALGGLPTEEKPSGGFPKNENEVDDPIALHVFVDDDKVCLDFGRSIRAVNIHPVAAHYLAALLSGAAFEAQPDLAHKGVLGCVDSQFAMVKGVDGTVREAVLRLPSPFRYDNEEENKI